MEKYNHIILEGSVGTWDMGSLQGPLGGTYTGRFKFKCFLTPTQQLAAAREYRELLGPKLELAPEHEGKLAYALTQLKYRVIDSPPFWQSPTQDGLMPGDIADINIVLAVLNAAYDTQLKYTELRTKERSGALDGAINAAEDTLREEGQNDDNG